MRTNPHSRHGKCGRLRFAGILDARAKADDARQVEEMRRKKDGAACRLQERADAQCHRRGH